MNVHKRCQTNVGNNCGVKTKEIAQMLAIIGQNAHDIKNKQKKVSIKSITGEPLVTNTAIVVVEKVVCKHGTFTISAINI